MADASSASYSTESIHVAAKFVALELTKEVMRRFTASDTPEAHAAKVAEVYGILSKAAKTS